MQYEKCILCGRDTPYKMNTPVDSRKYYVIGCGQLCVRCYTELQLDSE